MSSATRDADGDSPMPPPATSEDAAQQLLSPPRTSHPPPSNANGKRPLNTISNGTEDEAEADADAAEDVDSDMDPELAAAIAASRDEGNGNKQNSSRGGAGSSGAGGAGAAAAAAAAPKVHEASGYTWTRSEDAPGASWMSKKAVDEASRAMEASVHKESYVRGRYGDPFEMADREEAKKRSLAQQRMTSR